MLSGPVPGSISRFHLDGADSSTALLRFVCLAASVGRRQSLNPGDGGLSTTRTSAGSVLETAEEGDDAAVVVGDEFLQAVLEVDESG